MRVLTALLWCSSAATAVQLPASTADMVEVAAGAFVIGRDDDGDARIHRVAGRWRADAGLERHPVNEVSWAGASPYGVLDLAGNQWEWVSSLYQPYPYRAGDGRKAPTAAGVRGTRGGGHDSPPEELTTTGRGRTLSRAPRAGHHNIGFRCAR